MHCQELYWDDHRCPHMIQVRLKREKREALSSPRCAADRASARKTAVTVRSSAYAQNASTTRIQTAADALAKEVAMTDRPR